VILADENIHYFIIRTLREAGFTVISVSELQKGIKDAQVIEWALQGGYTILTEDKDFGEWVFAHHVKSLSVIFLRYSFPDFEAIAQSLCFFLQNTQLTHPVFVTITTKKIRMRQL
jgi:predicted nuclease of predicted toxin-antitoxin system